MRGESTLKKHRSRRALYGNDIWRWFGKEILQAERIPWTPIFIVLEGKSVRQNWYIRIKDKIFKKTALTYIGKGILLVPRWMKVPLWELAYLESKNANFHALGIANYNNEYVRLCYQQVEDLDHADRQQDHILDTYFEGNLDFAISLEELCAQIDRREAITKKIVRRKEKLSSYKVGLNAKMRASSSIVESYIKYAPLFKGEEKENAKRAVIRSLEQIQKELKPYCIRPVGQKLRYARKSLSYAIDHIIAKNYRLARRCLKSAAKNLKYPNLTSSNLPNS